uniref:Fibronectin type-III domain-containing protein n=1 Tax=Knipowitschia caucasica TaxID=637954 RepID=A0AAV2KNV0_KNICA
MLWTLLSLSLVHSSVSETLGTTTSFFPKANHSDGSMEVTSRDCGVGRWECYRGDCGNVILSEDHVLYNDGDFCQVQHLYTLHVPTSAPFVIRSNIGADVGEDISGLSQKWRNLTEVEVRTRSDTGRANSSPLTSSLPNLRIPVNCPRSHRLLRWDPDGDLVRCRFMSISQFDCEDCSEVALLPDRNWFPSVRCNCCALKLHPKGCEGGVFRSECSVLHTPGLLPPGGVLMVTYIMEDFPQTSINLSLSTTETRTRRESLSKVPVQFFITVDPPVPDCVSGRYLPEFVPPTPEHEAVVFAAVLQPFIVTIVFIANFSLSPELVHNGPVNMTVVRTATQEFSLVWTPAKDHGNQQQPVCYVVEVTSLVGRHQSEQRCFVVIVVNAPQFLSVTPANNSVLSVSLGHTLTVPVHVETPSSPYGLVFQGPANMTLNSTLGGDHFLLRWTPSAVDVRKNVTLVFFAVFHNFVQRYLHLSQKG